MPLSSLTDGFGPVSAVQDGDTVVATMHDVAVTLVEEGAAVRLSHSAGVGWDGAPDVEALERATAAVTLARPALTAATHVDAERVVVAQWVPADTDVHGLAVAVRDLVATVGEVAAAADGVGAALLPAGPEPTDDAGAGDEVEHAEPADDEPTTGDTAVDDEAADTAAEEAPTGWAAPDAADAVDDGPDSPLVTAGAAAAGATSGAVVASPGEGTDEGDAAGAPDESPAPAAADEPDAGPGTDEPDDEPVADTAAPGSVTEEPGADEADTTDGVLADEPVEVPATDDRDDRPDEPAADEPDEPVDQPDEPAVAAEQRETVWGYVHEPVPVRHLTQTDEVVGQLVPGQWYAVMQTGNGWAHVISADGSLEGWADDRRVIRST